MAASFFSSVLELALVVPLFGGEDLFLHVPVFDDQPVLQAEDVEDAEMTLAYLHMAQGDDEITLPDQLVDLPVTHRKALLRQGCGIGAEAVEPVRDGRVVLVILRGRDELGDPGVLSADQHRLTEVRDPCLVRLSPFQILDLGRAIDHGASRDRLGLECLDDIPMLDDPVIRIGVEEIGGNQLALTVVEALVDVQEDIRPVLERAHDLDVTNRVAFEERAEKGLEPLGPVSDASRVLSVERAGMGGERLVYPAVADAVEVKAGGMVKFLVSGEGFPCHGAPLKSGFTEPIRGEGRTRRSIRTQTAHFGRNADHKINRIDDLLPWRYAQQR